MRRGQGNTEFIIIVALIAIATIGVVTVFGENLRLLFAGSSDSLAGNSSVGNPGTKGNATSTLVTNRTLNSFGQANAYEPSNSKGGPSGGGGSATSAQ